MDSIVPMIQQLDKGLGNDLSFWNFGKHMARAWMAYTNIFNDAMEHLQGKYHIEVSQSKHLEYKITTASDDKFCNIFPNFQKK